MAVSKQKRDKIVQQALNEITFARSYKQGKIRNWQKNENLYYGKKATATDSRANVDLGRMQEFVHTLLSKIDNPLTFKFVKRKESQMKRVKRLNALVSIDKQEGDWDMKDLAGKKQGVIYGRAIYSYYADSIDGIYASHLENVDVYDFLVDPSGGGLDLENARYLGNYGIVRDSFQLKQGVKNGMYISSEVQRLTNGNAEEMTQEEQNKRNRIVTTNIQSPEKESGITTDKFKFWNWFTTFEGVRYQLTISETAGVAIRCEELTDLFPGTPKFPLGPWPFWSWAAFVDLTEYWSPSYADYVREIFMAQAVSINQSLDNSEQIIKPQVLVDVNAIKNLGELKYRRDGQIKVTGAVDVNRAVQFIRPNSIDTPLRMFEMLESIQEKASGVTAGAKGLSNETKVGIYEGEQANAADRFGLLNKSYAFGYRRFSKLYELGLRENLTKKVAVDLIGPNGIETEMVGKRDIFKANDDFGCLIEASDAETQATIGDQRNKVGFLQGQALNPIQNPKKAYEIGARIAGFDEDTIKELLDVSEYGDAVLLSEADEDIEKLLEGKDVRPNRRANLAYKQRVKDYLDQHEYDMDHEQFMQIVSYLQSLEPIIMQNLARQIAQEQLKTAVALPPGAVPRALSGNPAQTPNGTGLPTAGGLSVPGLRA